MPSPPNLADPEVEPSDEELSGLMARAFANVKSDHEAALERLRGEINALRAERRQQKNG